MGAAGIAAMAAKHSVQVSSMLQSVADARTLTAADHDRIREAYSTFIMDANSGETLNVRIVEALRSLVGNSRMPVEMIQGYVDSLHICDRCQDRGRFSDVRVQRIENHAKTGGACHDPGGEGGRQHDATRLDDNGIDPGPDPMRLSMLELRKPETVLSANVAADARCRRDGQQLSRRYEYAESRGGTNRSPTRRFCGQPTYESAADDSLVDSNASGLSPNTTHERELGPLKGDVGARGAHPRVEANWRCRGNAADGGGRAVRQPNTPVSRARLAGRFEERLIAARRGPRCHRPLTLGCNGGGCERG